jgi:hypothetical protein
MRIPFNDSFIVSGVYFDGRHSPPKIPELTAPLDKVTIKKL